MDDRPQTTEHEDVGVVDNLGGVLTLDMTVACRKVLATVTICPACDLSWCVHDSAHCPRCEARSLRAALTTVARCDPARTAARAAFYRSRRVACAALEHARDVAAAAQRDHDARQRP